MSSARVLGESAYLPVKSITLVMGKILSLVISRHLVRLGVPATGSGGRL